MINWFKTNFKVIAAAVLTFAATITATTTTQVDDKVVEMLQKLLSAFSGS